MKRATKDPKRGLKNFSHPNLKSNSSSKSSTSVKTENISKYFLKSQNQETSEDKNYQNQHLTLTDCVDSPFKNSLSDIDLNNVPSGDNDFKSPHQFKLKSFNVKNVSKLSNSKCSKKNLNRKKGNVMVKSAKENFEQCDVNGEHLQMALALSVSSQPEYCDDLNEEASCSSAYPSTQEKAQNVKKTLEQFGFKCDKSKLCPRMQFAEVFKKRKKSKFQYITPILFLRTQEERDNLISTKISSVLNENFNDSSISQTENSITEYHVCSDYLKDYVCNEKTILNLNSLNHIALDDGTYYVNLLNIDRSKTKCGYLLKKWEEIPGRELSPIRENEKSETHSKNEKFDFLETHLELPTTPNSKIAHKDSDKIECRSASPDLFSSEDEMVQEADREIFKTEYASQCVKNDQGIYHFESFNEDTVKVAKEFVDLTQSSDDEIEINYMKDDGKCVDNIVPKVCDNELNLNNFNIDEKINQVLNKTGISYSDDLNQSSPIDNDFMGVDNANLQSSSSELLYNELNYSDDNGLSYNQNELHNEDCNTISHSQETLVRQNDSIPNATQNATDRHLNDTSFSEKMPEDHCSECIEDVQTHNSACASHNSEKSTEGSTSINKDRDFSYTKETLFHEDSPFAYENPVCLRDDIENVLSTSQVSDDTSSVLYKENTSQNEVFSHDFRRELDNIEMSGNLNVTDYVNSILNKCDSSYTNSPNVGDRSKTFISSDSEESVLDLTQSSDDEIHRESKEKQVVDTPNENIFYTSVDKPSSFQKHSSFSSISSENMNFSDEELNYSSMHSFHIENKKETDLCRDISEKLGCSINGINICNDEDKMSRQCTPSKNISHLVEDNCRVAQITQLEKENRTPQSSITVKTDNITPMPNYDAMNTPTITKELSKYGIKNLKRRRGKQLLEYIYNTTHPLVDAHTMENKDEEGRIVKKRKTLFSGGTNNGQNKIEIVGELVSNTEPIENLVFERKFSSKIPSCRVPLQIAWHNFLTCNPDIFEKILLYEPLQLEDLYQMLKKEGYKYHIEDILSFLDRKCITIRTNQNQRQQSRSKKI